MFAPLHAKSDYSLGFGTASVSELAARAAELGYGVLGLADIENLYGQVRFHAECRARGIRPLTGVELRPGFVRGRRPGDRQGSLVLLAADWSGYANLCRIVSLRSGGGRGGDSGAGGLAAALTGRTAGLFALSDDPRLLAGILSKRLFDRSRLGLLLIRPAVPDNTVLLRGMARELGVPLVADLDAVFLTPLDRDLHLLQLAVHRGATVSGTAGDPAAESPERWLRPPREAAALFADLPEALSAAEQIAESCQFELGRQGLARTALPVDSLAGDKLRGHCHRALVPRRAAGTWSQSHEERLAAELAIFERLGFAGLLLIVAEILAFCREQRITAVARGSAVSSLTLYLLGGSPVDPLAEGLLFERFLHPAKTAWPDVDLDLPWHRRDEVIAWVYRHFGTDRVAMVAAHHTFRRRLALREGLKACGLPPNLIAALAAALPAENPAVEEVDFLNLATPEGKDFLPLPPGLASAVLPRILPLVQRLIGRPRHIATHPGGIVIGGSPLADLLPLERAPKGVIITQYDLAAIAELGLVKIDLLGNRCLSELEETLALAGRPARLEDVPAEDPAALALIDRAATLGCFQLESPAMRSLLARLPVKRKSDVTAALALIRPGPASGAAKDAFIRRARGEEPAEVAEPAIADRLAETCGLPLYEEDIMMLLSRVGGIDLAEADELRAAIVESGGEREMLARLEENFLGKARRNRPGQGAARARQAWACASRFAAYSFNKAHAASYAHLGYLAAYMKTHHPVQFACALLNHHQGLYPLRTLAADFGRRGIILRPPHVNFSEYPSTLEASPDIRDGPIRVGLDKIKGLAARAAHDILLERAKRGAFINLPDLLSRVRLTARDRRSLILSGACDGLPPLAPKGFPFVHQLVLEKLKEGVDHEEILRLPPPGVREDTERFRQFQKLSRIQNELPLLGMHLSAHPLALLRTEAGRYECLPIVFAVTLPVGVRIRLIALVAAMRRVLTARGVLQFLTLEDETGLMESAVLPPVYARLGNRVTTPGPFLVEGRIRRPHGAVHLEVTGLTPFHERPRPYGRQA